MCTFCHGASAAFFPNHERWRTRLLPQSARKTASTLRQVAHRSRCPQQRQTERLGGGRREVRSAPKSPAKGSCSRRHPSPIASPRHAQASSLVLQSPRAYPPTPWSMSISSTAIVWRPSTPTIIAQSQRCSRRSSDKPAREPLVATRQRAERSCA